MALSPCEEDARVGQLFIIHATQSFRRQVPQDASLVCEEQLLFTSSSYLNDTVEWESVAGMKNTLAIYIISSINNSLCAHATDAKAKSRFREQIFAYLHT